MNTSTACWWAVLGTHRCGSLSCRLKPVWLHIISNGVYCIHFTYSDSMIIHTLSPYSQLGFVIVGNMCQLQLKDIPDISLQRCDAANNMCIWGIMGPPTGAWCIRTTNPLLVVCHRIRYFYFFVFLFSGKSLSSTTALLRLHWSWGDLDWHGLWYVAIQSLPRCYYETRPSDESLRDQDLWEYTQ